MVTTVGTTATTATVTSTTTAAAMVTTAALTSALKTAGRMKVTVPPEFKGAESAMRWFARFEICSRSNGWDEAAMFAQVLPLMGGDALDLLLDKDETALTTYDDVKRLMIQEFDNRELREHYVQDFKARRRREGEEYNVFMRALKILAAKAYPDFDGVHRNALVADRYREEMPEKVRAVLPLLSLDPQDLDKLVSETRRLSKVDSHRLSSPGVAAVSSVADNSGGAVGGVITNDILLAKLMDIEARFARMNTAQGDLELRVNNLYSGSRPSETKVSSTGGGRRSDRTKSVVCYECHQTGHFKRDCPSRRGGASGGGGPQFYPHVVCTKCGNNGHYASACNLQRNA